MKNLRFALMTIAILGSCLFLANSLGELAELDRKTSTARTASSLPNFAASSRETNSGLARATFAGGCFWCMEPPFDKLDGVVSTTSGYAGGDETNPTYEGVSAGRTGHAEVVQVVYDPKKVSYEKLLQVFWRNIDPLTADRQFCDGGRQYRTAIFAHDAGQLAAAKSSKNELESSRRFERPIVTEITYVKNFTPAEAYHQNYYIENPIRYKYYRRGCGRDARLQQLWGDEAGGKPRG